jgi:uncharacterized membrane protein YbaN (DUF454 family)
MPPGAKSRAMIVIVITFAVSLWLVPLWWVRVMLLIMLAVLLLFIGRMPVVAETADERLPPR